MILRILENANELIELNACASKPAIMFRPLGRNIELGRKLHLNVWFTLRKVSNNFINRVFFLLLLLSFFFSCSLYTGNTKKSAAADEPIVQTPMEKIAETLSRKITTPNSKLIVLTFTNTEGKDHKLGNLFAEKLTTDLVRRGNVVVLDRNLFSKQILDNNLNLSSSNDLREIRKIGELLGLNAIVTGMITSFNTGYGLNCRIIDTKTGFILAAEEAFYAGE